MGTVIKSKDNSTVIILEVLRRLDVHSRKINTLIPMNVIHLVCHEWRCVTKFNIITLFDDKHVFLCERILSFSS